jgi:hypothetical protein
LDFFLHSSDGRRSVCIVNAAFNAVLKQKKNAHNSLLCVVFVLLDLFLMSKYHIVLVGGFAASDWVYTSVDAQLDSKGLNFLHPQSTILPLATKPYPTESS